MNWSFMIIFVIFNIFKIKCAYPYGDPFTNAAIADSVSREAALASSRRLSRNMGVYPYM